jgi:hypothetical protein
MAAHEPQFVRGLIAVSISPLHLESSTRATPLGAPRQTRFAGSRLCLFRLPPRGRGYSKSDDDRISLRVYDETAYLLITMQVCVALALRDCLLAAPSARTVTVRGAP